jgi:hypothetical protein
MWGVPILFELFIRPYSVISIPGTFSLFILKAFIEQKHLMYIMINMFLAYIYFSLITAFTEYCVLPHCDIQQDQSLYHS